MADLVERGLRTLCFAKSRAGGRADPPLHRRPARRRLAALALPRRLHARAAARDRAAAARGRAARRQRDERARARDRRRPARLRDLGRLPRHGRLAAPAVGPRRPPRARAGGARRQRGRARPVLHARAARRCSAGASRPRSSTTRTRACSTATSARPPSRRRWTTATARCSATRRSSARPSLPELAAHEGRLRLGRPRLPGRARLAALDRPGVVHDRRRLERHGARDRRAGARLHDRARGRDLPPPRRELPRARARPRERAPPSSSRSPATTTRRPRPRRRPRSSSRGASDRRLGRGAHLRLGRRHRPGRRLPEEVDPDAGEPRARPARAAADRVRDRGRLVPPGAVDARGPRADAAGCSGRCTPPSTR